MRPILVFPALVFMLAPIAVSEELILLKPNGNAAAITPIYQTTAKALLDGGADPMTLSQLGGTALHEAAASGGKEIILLLLENKVDPTVKSKEGVTALDIAKKYKNQPAVNILSGLK